MPQAIRPRVRRRRRHVDGLEASFLQTINLTAEAVELGIGGDETRPLAQRERRKPPCHEFVGVLAKRNVLGPVAQQPGIPGPYARGLDLSLRPFPVDVFGRIEPGVLLRLESDVRPGLVGVAGQQQPFANAEARVVTGERVRSLTCHASMTGMGGELRKSVVKAPPSTIHRAASSGV